MAEDNVVTLQIETTLPISVERVLTAAIVADLERVTILGRTRDGEFYFAGSEGDSGVVLYDLEKARWQLMRMEEDD